MSTVKRYRFLISDGTAFEYVGEGIFARSLAAEAHAVQVAKELSEDDTWHGGWISVTNCEGDEIARVRINAGRTPTK